MQLSSAQAEVRIRSEAFLSGGAIPRRHTGEGDDISPSIRWDRLPENAMELALICDDPDASAEKPWVHWVIYNITADEVGIPEGVPTSPKVDEPFGALQGRNSWNSVGYRGPMPPPGSGIHRYRFRLYVLNTELTVAPELDKDQLLKAMQGKVIAQVELVGTYSR